ncbi:WD40 repeat domain-containing protein [Chloropicon primus]|uniref:WD40 repeat domain-containing protein n=1 Tax=Chloropicon primus TaxID=1764295 RepID=A0A5B8MHY2_9CHLO|nr:WD40 repeat domain-containing protein [Chloropicon primus]UPQ98188.1 WD40 repeat domain-containing protein [Chloropicon primus]|mmetsp:Transcript_9382/g.26685  ORF Transcript_9382/g.26685 Transcript_9382/m.26685 type:complete len:840 (-) Transcript_9382:2594-5113(-)|eukprot:QDZ18980.1 WD40 repeat domain-containing protein [Chloropicon primus]
MKVRRRRLTYVLEHSRNGSASTSSEGEAAALGTDQKEAGSHCGAVNSLAVGTGLPPSDGRRGGKECLFTASRDATIKRWQIGAGDGLGGAKLEMSFEGHVDWVNDVAVLEKENTLVSCSNDRTVRLWRANASKGRDGTDAGEVDDYGLISTLYEHSDYVMCVSAAREAKTFVSAGLRSEIKLWDLETTVRTSKIGPSKRRDSASSSSDSQGGSPNSVLRDFDCASVSDASSCYSCDINPSGSVLACGSTDGIVRIWDTRSNTKNEEGALLPQMALRGHLGNIRCIRLNRAGTMCITGSSDKTVRIWDLGQQRCMHSFSIHKDSVWALDFVESHGQIVSGGRDGQVFCTSLSGKLSTLLFEEEKSVLSLSARSRSGNTSSRSGNMSSGSESLERIWSATNSSSIHFWDLTQPSTWDGEEGESGGSNSYRERRHSSFVASTSPFSIKQSSLSKSMGKGKPVIPLQRTPSLTLVGVPPIVKHEILNDRQRILTEDASGTICMWNVLTGRVDKCFNTEEVAATLAKADEGKEAEDKKGGATECGPGRGDVEAKEGKNDQRFEKFFACINPKVTASSWFSADKRLGKLSIHMESKQCFSAEVYAVDLGMEEVGDDLKFNMGQQVLCSLFSKWEQANQSGRDGETGAGGRKDVSDASGAAGGADPSNSSSPSAGKVAASDQGQSPQKGGGKAASKLADWPFKFDSNPCIITTTYDGEWFTKRIEDLDGTETSDEVPDWVVSCVSEDKLPTGLNLKVSFHLMPHPDSELPSLQQGKLLAPKILPMSKVLHYVATKVEADQQDIKASDLELLCNDKLLTPEMSLAKVRQSVWKRSDDILIQFRERGA